LEDRWDHAILDQVAIIKVVITADTSSKVPERGCIAREEHSAKVGRGKDLGKAYQGEYALDVREAVLLSLMSRSTTV
jgi:hypothetical protein